MDFEIYSGVHAASGTYFRRGFVESVIWKKGNISCRKKNPSLIWTLIDQSAYICSIEDF